jgi:hypothetical protein
LHDLNPYPVRLLWLAIAKFVRNAGTVVMNNVASQCILARLMIAALGRPGVDNDMEFMGSGDRWIVVWTQPKLTIDETREVVNKAIAPTPSRTL